MTVWLEIGGKLRRVEVPGGAASGLMECVVDGIALAVDVRMLQDGVLSLVLTDGPEAGRQFRCVADGDSVVVDGRRVEFVVADPRSLAGRRGGGSGAEGPRAVKAPMPGRVVRVLVAVGDEVAELQGLVVLEAMKMQNELKAPKAGRVVKVGVSVGDTVEAGSLLVVVE